MRGHPGRVLDRGQVHERDALGEFAGDTAPHLDGESRLAHPGRADEGDEPCLIAVQKALDRLQIAVSTEESGRLCLPLERRFRRYPFVKYLRQAYSSPA